MICLPRPYLTPGRKATMKLDAAASEALAWELHRANFSGGSSLGMSFYADAAKCGMRAMLNSKRKAEQRADPNSLPSLEGESKERKNAFAVGSGYHKLHELLRGGAPVEADTVDLTLLKDHEPLICDLEHFSASHIEALRLFNGWMAHWPIGLWGEVIATEKEILCPIGDYNATAMPDLVVKVREQDLPLIQCRCPAVVDPGYYIIDLKTSDVAYEENYYRSSLQALWYPHAWNEVETAQPVMGIIFDTMYKFGRRKDKSVSAENFGAIYVPSDFTSSEPLIGLVEQAQANISRAQSERLGNRAECHQFSFGGTNTCRFYGNGCSNGL